MEKLKLSDIRKPLKIEVQQECCLFRVKDAARCNIDFDILLSDGTPLQRPFCWNMIQKSELIKSVLKDIKIPPIYVIRGGEEDNTYRIIDGKQRVSALIDFYNGKFPVMVNGVDYFYFDLDKDAQDEIAYLNITGHIAYEPLKKTSKKWQTVKFADLDLIQWFELINFSGTPQDASHIDLLKSKIQ